MALVVIDTILTPRYPKSGNTLLGTTLNLAGSIKTDFDIYAFKSQICDQILINYLKLLYALSKPINQMKRHMPKLDDLYFGKVVNLSLSQEIHSKLS